MLSSRNMPTYSWYDAELAGCAGSIGYGNVAGAGKSRPFGKQDASG